MDKEKLLKLMRETYVIIKTCNDESLMSPDEFNEEYPNSTPEDLIILVLEAICSKLQEDEL